MTKGHTDMGTGHGRQGHGKTHNSGAKGPRAGETENTGQVTVDLQDMPVGLRPQGTVPEVS